MTKYNFNQAVPLEPTHEGTLIADELAARNMTQSKLSELTGIPRPVLNDIIKGRRSVTPKIALALEDAFGIPAEFIMNVQTQYKLDCARMERRETAAASTVIATGNAVGKGRQVLASV